MHFSPAHARRRQNAREGPVEGSGEAAWGLPPPNWRIPVHTTKAQHHQHGRPCPNVQRWRAARSEHPPPTATATKRQRRPYIRTAARRTSSRRAFQITTRGIAAPPAKNKERTTNSAGTHRSATSDKTNSRQHSAGTKIKSTAPLPSPSGGFERSLLPAGGGYAGGTPLATEENRTEKAAHHTRAAHLEENKLALIEPLPLPDDDAGGVPAINGDI